MRRLPGVVTVGLALVILVTTPAAAAGPKDDSFVVLTGALRVPAGEVVGDAVIFNGDANIVGTVTGTAIAFNGDVTVSGRVREDVVALNGRVTLDDGAEVGGDVVSHSTPEISPTATYGGRIRGATYNISTGRFTFLGRFLIWLGASISSFLLGLLLVLLAPRAAEATASAAATRVGPSIGLGFGLLVGLPIVAIIAMALVVGLFLGLGVLLALGLIYWLGYVAGAFAFGRRLIAPPRNRVLAFLLGWGILRLIALIPFVGALAWLAATVWGLGALAVAAWMSGRTPAAPAAAGPSLALPPPPPIPTT